MAEIVPEYVHAPLGSTGLRHVTWLLPLERIEPIGLGVRLRHDGGPLGYVELTCGQALLCRWAVSADELDRLRRGWHEANGGLAELLASLWVPQRCRRCATVPAPTGPGATACVSCGASLTVLD